MTKTNNYEVLRETKDGYVKGNLKGSTHNFKNWDDFKKNLMHKYPEVKEINETTLESDLYRFKKIM